MGNATFQSCYLWIHCFVLNQCLISLLKACAYMSGFMKQHVMRYRHQKHNQQKKNHSFQAHRIPRNSQKGKKMWRPLSKDLCFCCQVSVFLHSFWLVNREPLIENWLWSLSSSLWKLRFWKLVSLPQPLLPHTRLLSPVSAETHPCKEALKHQPVT